MNGTYCQGVVKRAKSDMARYKTGSKKKKRAAGRGWWMGVEAGRGKV